MTLPHPSIQLVQNLNDKINYQFMHDQPFEVWKNSERNIIDTADVVQAADLILKNNLYSNQVINEEDKIVEEETALLQRLVDNPSLKITLGKRSRELAIEKFSGEVFCKQYKAVFYP